MEVYSVSLECDVGMLPLPGLFHRSCLGRLEGDRKWIGRGAVKQAPAALSEKDKCNQIKRRKDKQAGSSGRELRKNESAGGSALETAADPAGLCICLCG